MGYRLVTLAENELITLLNSIAKLGAIIKVSVDKTVNENFFFFRPHVPSNSTYCIELIAWFSTELRELIFR